MRMVLPEPGGPTMRRTLVIGSILGGRVSSGGGEQYGGWGEWRVWALGEGAGDWSHGYGWVVERVWGIGGTLCTSVAASAWSSDGAAGGFR